MKKRLRKKLHRGEFQEFGFNIQFNIKPELTDATKNNLIDRFLTEAIEANGLQFGGGGLDIWEGFACLDGRGTATDQHRELVRSWLNGTPEITEFHISELVDAWV